ncbi:MAG: response regulator transcription factor [Erysipelotrichaceae bacterium]|nr:response regulator transcription factor [Erysipelotrichaceae bacterium]
MKDNKKCILIADDEKEIRDVLTLLLESEDYFVLSVDDGNKVLENASKDIDLYILDVNMPTLNGFKVASELRKKYDTPIIFLTAYSSESDKVMGFSIGADDYIVKPFSNVEFLLRVKARLRRSSVNNNIEVDNTKVQLVDAVLDLNSQCIIKEDETIALTYTEFKILELLVLNRKKIFSLDQIYQNVWNDNAIGDEAIMVHIKNIRKKLNDNSRNSKYIKTAWGRGYYVE